MSNKYFSNDDHGGFDLETGIPTLQYFSIALQVWAVANYPCSVKQAAEAFKVPDTAIIEAVEQHSWMYLQGPEDDTSQLMIEHEGE